MTATNKKQLSPTQFEELLSVLKNRFDKNTVRHQDLNWLKIETKLKACYTADKNDQGSHQIWSLSEMERTGGEPDVVAYDKKTDAYIFYDCSAESPVGRRSLCYDRAALDARKENKPKDDAMHLADTIGIEILTEAQYRGLQQLGNFDTKTSSWIVTPPEIRELGGALFCDRRYGKVFVYHNGAESYYAARGFRGALKI